jgi:outer membrane protein
MAATRFGRQAWLGGRGPVLAFLATAAISMLVATGRPVRADEAKIGIIDSQRIFAEYQEAKDAEVIFQQEMDQWQKDLGQMEKEILAQQEKIRSQSLLLSKEKLDEMQQDLDTMLRNYDAKKTEILDPNKGKAVLRNQELSQPINDQISTVVERIGAEGKFTIILDVATVNVVYAAEGVDLTDQVLEELEKKGE